jgi:hypothetical protein
VPRRVVLAAAAALAVAIAPAAAAGVFVDRTVKALRAGDHVYVDPAARSVLPSKLADFLRSHIARTGGAAFYAAILPPFAAHEVDGSLQLLADTIGRRLDCTCTVAVVVGGRYAALSSALPHGKDRELLAEAVAKHGREGVVDVLEDLDTRVATEIDREQSGGGSGIALGAGLTALVVAALGLVVIRRRRWWRELGRARVATEAELAELQRRLPREAVERVERELALARRPRDLERVRRALDEARALAPR